MFDAKTLMASALALGLAFSAYAQETAPADAPATTETPATETPAAAVSADQVGEMSMGEPTDGGVGSVYGIAEHGDWTVRCIKSGEATDPCELYQLLKDGNGNSVAEISLFHLPPGGEAVAGATIITPLETLLPQMITMKVDSGQSKRYPFTFCAVQGCVSRVGFTAAEIDGLKKGNKAELIIVPAVAPDEKVTLGLSLKGFTAGYDAVAEPVPAQAAPAADAPSDAPAETPAEAPAEEPAEAPAE